MNGQRIIGITFVAIIMLIAIVLLIQAGRFILGGNSLVGTEDSSETEVAATLSIDDYIESRARATFVQSGEITSNEEYNQIEIEITPSKRELRIINGYTNTVSERKSFKNNEEAYAAFIYAIDFEGILLKQEAVYPTSDGVCPTGLRYSFNLDVDGTDDDLESWAASCGKRFGDFAGDRRGIENLFEKQIPDFKSLTSGVSLRN